MAMLSLICRLVTPKLLKFLSEVLGVVGVWSRVSSANYFPYCARSLLVVCYEVQCVALGEFFLGKFEFNNSIIFFVVTNELGDVCL